MKGKYLFLLLIMIAAAGCREQYDPKVKSLEQSFLVVEANLNPGPDSTDVFLTKTLKLSDPQSVKVEANANVIVEGEDNSAGILNNIGGGHYYSNNLNLTIGTKYRLRIQTFDGKEYLSDYVTARVTPPIDSIGLDRTPDGATIYVNTSDPANATRYYRWEYDETWEINSYFYSQYIYENGGIRPRNLPSEDVYQCWKYATATSIRLANSIRLQNDVIYKAKLVDIPSGSDKLSVRYSILAKQYALDREAYNFYEQLKRNTEEVGGLFTPLPSELTGNIKCLTDPTLFVIGYVTASTIQQKRVFFNHIPWDFRQFCETKEVPDNPDSIRVFFSGGLYMPYAYNPFPPTYYGSTDGCVDCRTRGGTKLKPSYW
ncbi:MAG: DUF4249 domain-containing protein [Chitinophagaceae bacterium]